MPGGKSPKRKGDAGEREFAALLGSKRTCRRTYWQPGDEVEPDLIDRVLGRGEVKRRENGWKQLYAWLGYDPAVSGEFANDFLAVRADRKPWLVVIPLNKLQPLLELAVNEGW